jgi:hypothetical protein
VKLRSPSFSIEVTSLSPDLSQICFVLGVAGDHAIPRPLKAKKFRRSSAVYDKPAGRARRQLFPDGAARAQQPAMPLIGIIYSGSADTLVNRASALRKGLSETGYAEGQNCHGRVPWAVDNER